MSPERDDVVGEVAIRSMEARLFWARAADAPLAYLDAMTVWIALARGRMRPMPEAPR